MIDGLHHVGTDHKCTICQCDFSDDEGGTLGYLGVLPVAFCPPCFSGLCDMIDQTNEDEWVDLTNEEIGEIYRVGWANNMELARAIEAKLKEKNYEST